MRLYFSPSIDERDWHVWRPLVKLGEYEGQFFFYVDKADADRKELLVPPRGLYGKEFLELDYRDPLQLMGFQQKWGPITGLRARPNALFDSDASVDVSCLGGIAGLGRNHIPYGAQKTIFLYEGYGEVDEIAKERFGTELSSLRDVVRAHWDNNRHRKNRKEVVPCHVASVEEVAEAVCHAQIAITAITDCLRDDFGDDDWHSRKPLVENSLRYCNASIQGTVVPIDLIEVGNNFGTCTLMQYLFICMVQGSICNETYRNCQNPDCRRLFTPEQFNRRADSRYCSQECQVKAKHIRTYKPKRKAEKPKRADTARATNEIVLSWSESDFPVRVLRKGEVDVAAAYSFMGLDCGSPENEDYIALYGLDIPNPSAQNALKRY